MAVLGFVGGLRSAELKSLSCENVIRTDEGYYIKFTPAKQRSDIKESEFYVPINKKKPSECFAVHISAYLDIIVKSLGRLDGPLFKTCTKTGVTKTPLGINYVYKAPKEIAEKLGLNEPQKFTGHAFRRSSATHCANQGASTMDMRMKFHWKDDQMPGRYVENSRYQSKKLGKMMTKPNDMVDQSQTAGDNIEKKELKEPNDAVDQSQANGSNILKGKGDSGKNIYITVAPGASLDLGSAIFNM